MTSSDFIWTEEKVREEFECRLVPPFDGKESEDNWQARDESLNHFRRLIDQSSFIHNSAFVSLMKQLYLEHICQAVS